MSPQAIALEDAYRDAQAALDKLGKLQLTVQAKAKHYGANCTPDLARRFRVANLAAMNARVAIGGALMAERETYAAQGMFR